jgi:hypothetical protein
MLVFPICKINRRDDALVLGLNMKDQVLVDVRVFNDLERLGY